MVVEVIIKHAEGAFKNVPLSDPELVWSCILRPLLDSPPCRCCSALSCLFNCYVNVETLCFQQEATDWCSNSLNHETVICPPKLRGLNWSRLNEMCMLMCIKRSPATPETLKQAGITIGDSPLLSFTPWALLKKTRVALLCIYCIAVAHFGCVLWRLLPTTAY